MAVAEAGVYSSDSTPSLGTSICHGCSPKMTKEKKKEGNEKPSEGCWNGVSEVAKALCNAPHQSFCD